MKNKKLVLATDLDGTFLEGDHEHRQAFYDKLANSREDISVVFVTGRTLDLVYQLYSDGLSYIPDYIIADHGTLVINSQTLNPVTAVQDYIIEQWDKADHEQLGIILRKNTSLTKQPYNPRFRYAYYYNPTTLNSDVIEEIKALGFDCVLSHDAYFDILPANVGKGSSLRRLMGSLEISDEKIITCGDSLNDLSLFTSGYGSIAVGNSEPALKRLINSMDNVFLSQHPGIYGILDGLDSLGVSI